MHGGLVVGGDYAEWLWVNAMVAFRGLASQNEDGASYSEIRIQIQ